MKGFGFSFQAFTVAEVLLQRLHGSVIGALQQFAGHFGEQPLDLVDPGRVGRREVHVEPGMLMRHVFSGQLFWLIYAACCRFR